MTKSSTKFNIMSPKHFFKYLKLVKLTCIMNVPTYVIIVNRLDMSFLFPVVTAIGV